MFISHSQVIKNRCFLVGGQIYQPEPLIDNLGMTLKILQIAPFMKKIGL